ncbi:MAG: hypothetical protein ABSF83_00570 [Nitrososphaerales archaeon]|jgi:hypothetical protein
MNTPVFAGGLVLVISGLVFTWGRFPAGYPSYARIGPGSSWVPFAILLVPGLVPVGSSFLHWHRHQHRAGSA